jgi:hypothetical protein
MAVGIRLRFAGGTQEQYQAVHDTVSAISPLGRADGLLVHLGELMRREVGRRERRTAIFANFALCQGGPARDR